MALPYDSCKNRFITPYQTVGIHTIVLAYNLYNLSIVIFINYKNDNRFFQEPRHVYLKVRWLISKSNPLRAKAQFHYVLTIIEPGAPSFHHVLHLRGNRNDSGKHTRYRRIALFSLHLYIYFRDFYNGFYEIRHYPDMTCRCRFYEAAIIFSYIRTILKNPWESYVKEYSDIL